MVAGSDSSVVGHSRVLSYLEGGWDPVLVFRGPESVGKRTICEHIIERNGVKTVDTIRVFNRPLTVDDAREAKRFMSVAPMGPYKVLAARLDGSSPAALNALLKVLEEPTPRARFLFTTIAPVLLTVASRATVLSLGYLKTEEVEEVLLRRGFDPDDAAAVAELSGGQVKRALDMGDASLAKGPVVTLIRGVALGDEALILNALNGNFDERQLRLLRLFCIESRTRIWRVFSAEDAYGLERTPGLMARIYAILNSGARPRVAARTALLEAMEAVRVRV